MKIKIKCTSTAIDPITNKEWNKEKIIEVPDEELLYKEGYQPTNVLYDYAERCKIFLKPHYNFEYKICEDGLSEDIPYITKEGGFNKVEDLYDYLRQIKINEDKENK